MKKLTIPVGMGFVHSLRGHLFEANLTSRRLARQVQAYLARH